MCIRDSNNAIAGGGYIEHQREQLSIRGEALATQVSDLAQICLLYTSDAADERSSVDLGGRRIIKKKSNLRPPRSRVHSKRDREQEDHVDIRECSLRRVRSI